MSEIRDFRASSEAEASETFKWYKRTLYQPAGKLDGNPEDGKRDLL